MKITLLLSLLLVSCSLLSAQWFGGTAESTVTLGIAGAVFVQPLSYQVPVSLNFADPLAFEGKTIWEFGSNIPFTVQFEILSTQKSILDEYLLVQITDSDSRAQTDRLSPGGMESLFLGKGWHKMGVWFGWDGEKELFDPTTAPWPEVRAGSGYALQISYTIFGM